MKLLGVRQNDEMAKAEDPARGLPDPTNPPRYLAKHLEELEARARWLQGEIQIWEEREEAAKQALQELRAIEEQNQATIRQLLPTEIEEGELMRDFEENLQKLGEEL